MTRGSERRPAGRRGRGRAAPGLPSPLALGALRPVILLGAIALVVAILYMARALLMPIAVAILLTFLLHPLVSALERRRVPRILAVVLVVVLVFSALGALVSTMAWQVTSLAAELPRYRDNMRRKVAEIRGAGQGGVVEEVTETAREVTKELEKSDQPPPPGERPLPVVVRSERTGLWQLPSLLEGLAGAGVVVVLVIFMLLERDELRDRLFRLIGYARLTTTTRALDEAGRRISRYLLMQTVINVTFGLGVGVGLALIGLPYAALWGVLGAILRFIPYVGPWIAALAPIALSVATAVGWQQPILVAGLFLVLELLANMVLEPVLYGQSAGVSQVALLIAVAFWTWLWGAVGLALATPLTVCLVVLGKYVPELGFIGVLMADQPPLAHDARFYQRLLALDRDGAAGVVRDYEGEHAPEHVYDRVVVPALNRLERDHARGALDADEHEAAVRVAREVLEADAAARREAGGAAPAGVPDAEAPPEAPRRLLLGAPARGASDEVALHLLRYLLEPAGWEVEVLSPRLLAAELLAAVEARRPAAVCIGAVPSGAAAAHTRYLCKRLRARFPGLRLVVGRWAPGARVARIGDRILASGADHFATTLVGTRDQIRLLARLDLDAPREPVPAGPAPA